MYLIIIGIEEGEEEEPVEELLLNTYF